MLRAHNFTNLAGGVSVTKCLNYHVEPIKLVITVMASGDSFELSLLSIAVLDVQKALAIPKGAQRSKFFAGQLNQQRRVRDASRTCAGAGLAVE